MIYIKGINPTNNRIVYYRGTVHAKNTAWTEKLLQAIDLKTNTNAQNTLNNIQSMNMSIHSYVIVNDITINTKLLQQQTLVLKQKDKTIKLII